jgi:hypothetical protein
VGEQNEPWKIDELIAEGYDFLEEQKITKACFIWEKVWEEIKKVLTPEIRSVTELGYSLGDAGNVENWCQDYEMELENAGVEDLSFFKKRITYCREFVKLLPESDPLFILVGPICTGCFELMIKLLVIMRKPKKYTAKRSRAMLTTGKKS